MLLTQDGQLEPATLELLVEIQTEYDRWSDLMNSLKADLLDEMKAKNVNSIKCGDFTITKVAAVTKMQFDSSRFKEEFGEMYAKYLKPKSANAYVKITHK